MRHNRAIAVLLLAFFAAQLFGGCSAASSETIRMDIDGPVLNLDPQFCDDPTAQMILLNLYEGLLIRQSDGEIVPGAAESYRLTPDGLGYTFTLREDACWEDGSPLLAEDFVFAFARMFSQAAPSPFAQDFLMIDGAREVLENDASLSRLGVWAEGERTVAFRLDQPSELFPALLATTPALPCSRETFERSRGRYGLELDFVVSNGPFRLERWDNTRYIYLARNENFRADAQALPDRVALYIGRDNPAGQFFDGKSDLAILSGSQIARAQEEKAQLLPSTKTVWCVVFNEEDAVWGNPLLRQSLACTLDYSVLEDSLSPGLTRADAFIPPSMMIGGTPYRELAGGASLLGFDIRRGQYLYRLGLDALELDKLPPLTLYLPDSGEHELYMSRIKQAWENNLDIHINIVPLGGEQLAQRLQAGDFQLMLIPFTPSKSDPDTLLGDFRSAGSRNYIGYRSHRFDGALDNALRQSEPKEAARYYKAAEDILLADAAVIPVCFETVWYALEQGLSGVEILPFGGQILFRGAEK